MTTKAKVYFNIRKRVFSVVVAGRVAYHANMVMLGNCKFKVSEAGRLRVLKQGRKNVHAFIYGDLLAIDMPITVKDDARQVTYNPYKYETFVSRDTLERIDSANLVYLKADQERPNIFVLRD
jgi:hypothetical protein